MMGETPTVGGGVIHVLTAPEPGRRSARRAAEAAAADPDVVRSPERGRRPAAARLGREASTPAPRLPLRIADEEDMRLVRAYRDGDVHAFEVFFARYRDRIRNLCLRYLPEEAADDAVQETFLHFVRTIDRVEEGYRVSSWIQRIAVNLCHDELRRRGRRRRLFEPASDVTELAMLSVVDRDRTRQPESAHELQRTRDLVWDVAATLPPRQRAVLAMRELLGLPYPDIAGRLGTTTSAVETLVHRARERFKAEYLRLEGAQPGIAACRTTARLVGELGSLRPHQLRRVTMHLQVCPRCRLRHGHLLEPAVPDSLAS
jgi:RNA polymerase sigma-70 factor, ECF subfamily